MIGSMNPVILLMRAWNYTFRISYMKYIAFFNNKKNRPEKAGLHQPTLLTAALDYYFLMSFIEWPPVRIR